jgi:hypothetical protein
VYQVGNEIKRILNDDCQPSIKKHSWNLKPGIVEGFKKYFSTS